jgi:TetR/AcrR family transcriptional repressor of lmrAB and yxaGH operons
MSEPSTRERILRAAISLFQQRGYHGVGLTEILTEAQAPKGSLYHHFPQGKAQLAVAAVESVAADYEAAFERWRARGKSAADIVRRLARVQAGWLTHNEWRQAGLFSVLVQGFVPEAPELHSVLARVYTRRHQLLVQALDEDGADDTRGLATLALAALDGGMIQAAAARDARVLRTAADRAARSLESTAACRSCSSARGS